MGEEAMSMSRSCLLCSSPGGGPLPGESPSPAGFPSENEAQENKSSSPVLLNSSLWSVFVLRKLLHFPRWEVECLLRELGGVHHPGDWFALCEPCSQLAKQTMELHHQIFELERRIRDKRAEAIDKLRSSFLEEKKVERQQESNNNVGVTFARTTVREYFKVHLRGRQPERTSPSPEWERDDDLDEHPQSSCPPSPSSASSSSFVKQEVDGGEASGRQRNLEKRKEDDPSFIPKRRNIIRKGRGRPKGGGGTTASKRRRMTSANSQQLQPRRYAGKVAAPGEGTYCSICRRWFLPQSYPDHAKLHEGTNARRCKYCDYIPNPGSGKWDLSRHEKKHEEDPSYVFFKCDKCDYSCSTLSRKQFHIQKHKIVDNVETAPSGASVSCKLCSAQFENLPQATVHLRDSHGPQLGLKQYKCSECGKSCTSSGVLRVHKAKVHQKGLATRHKCDQCDFGCYRKERLEDHLAAAHSGGEKKVICDICGNKFFTKSGLRSHKTKHHNNPKGVDQKATEEEHACQHCDFVAPRISQLNSHKRRAHPDLFEIQCSECPQKFMNNTRMVHHYRVRHPGKSFEDSGKLVALDSDSVDDIDSRNLEEDDSKPGGGGVASAEAGTKLYKKRRKFSGESAVPGQGTYCSTCHRWFLSQSYPDHVKKVHEEQSDAARRRRCKYCAYTPKSSSSRWDLSRHERKHEEDPNNFVFFKCDKCDFSCATHNSKFSHLRKHKIEDNVETVPTSGAKSCKLCSAQFENLAKVTVHLRESHGPELGLKQYKCSECAMGFTSSSALRSHVITQHERKLRYECSECQFSCYAKASWDNHQAAFHSGGAKEYICDLCGKAVATKPGLRSHKLRAHRPEGAPPPPEGHACKLCCFVGTNNAQLNNHKQAEHPQLFQFQCSSCPQSFITMHGMIHHYRVKHPGVRI